jgi:hypothetical protein
MKKEEEMRCIEPGEVAALGLRWRRGRIEHERVRVRSISIAALFLRSCVRGGGGKGRHRVASSFLVLKICKRKKIGRKNWIVAK